MKTAGEPGFIQMSTDYQKLRQSGLEEAFPSYISDGALNQKRKKSCQSSKNKSNFKNGQKTFLP